MLLVALVAALTIYIMALADNALLEGLLFSVAAFSTAGLLTPRSDGAQLAGVGVLCYLIGVMICAMGLAGGDCRGAGRPH